MPKTAAALFDAESRTLWLRIRYDRNSDVRGTRNALLYLVEAPTAPRLRYNERDDIYLPLLGQVTAEYVAYGFGGYGGPPPTQVEHLDVYVVPGADVHWVRFVSTDQPGDQTRCVISFQKMLTAPEVLKIISAVREDLMAYIDDLLADQQFSTTNLKATLDGFMAQVKADSSPEPNES